MLQQETIFKNYKAQTVTHDKACVDSGLSKLHKCSMHWNEKCFYCEIGYDNLNTLVSKGDNEGLSLLKEKYEECILRLGDFDSQLDNFLKNIEYEIELRLDSLMEELQVLKLSSTEHISEIDIYSKLNLELNKLKEKQLKDLDEIDVNGLKELIKINLNTLKELSEFVIKMRYCNKKKPPKHKFELSEFIVNTSMKMLTNKNILCKKFQFESQNFILQKKYNLNELINFIFIDENLIALHYKNTNKVEFLNMSGEKVKDMFPVRQISALNGLIIVSTEEKIQTISKDLKICNEFSLTSTCYCIQPLNKNLFVMVLHGENLKIFYFDNFQCVNSIENAHNDTIHQIKLLECDKFASLSDLEIKIWDFDGKLLRTLTNDEKNLKFSRLESLIDDLILAESDVKEVVQMWNFETGELLNSFYDSQLIGIMPFGFLLRDAFQKDTYLEAYDRDGNYIGDVCTDDISQYCLKEIKCIKENFIVAISQNESDQSNELIFMEYKNFSSNSDKSLWINDLYKINFDCEESDSNKLKSLLLKLQELIDVAIKECLSKVKLEISRFLRMSHEPEINERYEKQAEFLENVRKDALEYLRDRSELKQYFKPPKELFEQNCESINSLDSILKYIQMRSEVNYQLEFIHESFYINQNDKNLKFSLKKNIFDLAEYYFSPRKYKLIRNFARSNFDCRGVLDFIHTPNDLFALLIQNHSLEIFSKHGESLKSITLNYYRKMLFSNNATHLVLCYKEIKTPINVRLSYDINYVYDFEEYETSNVALIVNLANFETQFYKLDFKFESVAFLKEGTLAFARDNDITIWSLSPFEQIATMVKPFESSLQLVALSGCQLAVYSNQIGLIKVFDAERNLLSELKTKKRIKRVEDLVDYKILIETNKIFIWDFKKNEMFDLHVQDLKGIYFNFLTYDKHFLVFSTANKLKFFNLTNNYFYTECDTVLNELKPTYPYADEILIHSNGMFIRDEGIAKLFTFNK